jgi:hypothetical protein
MSAVRRLIDRASRHRLPVLAKREVVARASPCPLLRLVGTLTEKGAPSVTPKARSAAPAEQQTRRRPIQERPFRAAGALVWRRLDLANHRRYTRQSRGRSGGRALPARLRLDVCAIRLARLRPGDVSLLVNQSPEAGRAAGLPSGKVREAFPTYGWPSSIRERKALYRAVGRQQMSHLPSVLRYLCGSRRSRGAGRGRQCRRGSVQRPRLRAA